MKRLFIIITVCLLSAIAASAQDGLAIARIFNGDYAKRHDVEEVILKGKALKATDLSLFRSIKAIDSQTIASKMERLVSTDANKASDKELQIKGGHLVYAFLAFNKGGGRYAYIFFRQTSGKGKNIATVAYMEGTLSPTEVKQKFLKK